MNDVEILRDLYRVRYGVNPDDMVRLTASGGDRIYCRLKSDRGACIGTSGDSLSDCKAFVALSGVFCKHGVSVPEVYAVSNDGLHYIQQDLGSDSLFSLLGTDGWRKYAELCLKSLVTMQSIPYDEWKDAVAYKRFSRRQVIWDLNYFKYEYLKYLKVPYDEDLLEDDFERFAEMLSSTKAGPQGFMMRDCQSRNVMIYDGRPWWIDYQGGRLGPVAYDAVSFLWQAKARLTSAERMELSELYASEYERVTGAPADDILDAVPRLAFLRTLQVLGAYGFRGFVEKRAHFIESISPALENLDEIYEMVLGDDFPELKKVCRYICGHSPIEPAHKGLLIKVFSFSYKRGYPEDLTGNGGGFMFDCRGMHNPGRYDEYKALTGLDKEVRDFLEKRGEAAYFVDKAFETVSPSVECYLRRGFSDMQIGFGCTGGRHRSVYCADSLAHRIKAAYPEADLRIIHREQNIVKEL